MAIGITREEISRKLYFRIPQHGVEMGDSVLMLLTPDHHENGPAHGYYLPFHAKQVVVSDTDGAPSILKAHHRHRRRAADAFFSLGVIYTGGKGLKVGMYDRCVCVCFFFFSISSFVLLPLYRLMHM